jgi:DNA-binding SARP family transcriptional activator
MTRSVAEQDLGRARSPSAFVQLMGGFGLVVAGEPVDLPDSTRRLVAFLALSDGPQERALVAATLWPGKAESRAAANLRSSLWRLPDLSGAQLVRSNRTCLGLDPGVGVDTRDLERAGWALVGGEDVLDTDTIDRTLFVADLLPGWYDDWVICERERLTQLQLHFTEALAYALLDAGRVPEALDVAVRLVAADPLREGSQRVLLRIYCHEGSLGQARRQYERYRAVLLTEFGCEPGLTIQQILAECSAAPGSMTPAPR